MANNQNDNLMTFGEHLEVFRRMLFRIIAITICLTVVIFCLKDTTCLFVHMVDSLKCK